MSLASAMRKMRVFTSTFKFNKQGGITWNVRDRSTKAHCIVLHLPENVRMSASELAPLVVYLEKFLKDPNQPRRLRDFEE